MKTIKYFLIFLFTAQYVFGQSIVISVGASIDVGLTADICATTYGNITGTLTGGGTQCAQLPLPVELVSFDATAVKNSAQLNWKTATEMNNYGFDIERINLTTPVPKEPSWEKIGFVAGHGNSNLPNDYSFTDSNPTGGNKFEYRIKQIDNNGNFEYSNIIEVTIVPDKFELSQNYPNPFNPNTTINYKLPISGQITLKVYNILGGEVATLVNEEKPAGSYEVNFNSEKLASGTYFYKLQAGSFIETKKMILLK